MWGLEVPFSALIRREIPTYQSGVTPANQSEESEVRELSGKKSGICSGTPFLRGLVEYLQAKGGSRTSSGLLSLKVRELHFIRFGLPESLLIN